MENNQVDPVDLERCYEHYRRHFGYGYEDYVYSLWVEEDGSAEIRRRATLRADQAINSIDVYLLLRKTREEGALQDEFRVVFVERSTPEPTVFSKKVADISKSRVDRTTQIGITPPLREGESITFETIERVGPKSVARLFGDLEDPENRPFNTFSLEISWPTKRLQLEVFLPFEYRGQAEPDVWRGLSRIPVGKAAERIKPDLGTDLVTKDEKDYFKLYLPISYPQQGFLYAIAWVPPEQPDSRSVPAMVTGTPEPITSNYITWLHLSDLHYRKAEDYNIDVVKKALLRDVQEMCADHSLSPDFIAFTGDLAYSSQPDQYEWVEKFLDQLMTAAGIWSRERVLVVPGNHDVNRSLIKDYVGRGLISQLNHQDEVSRFLEPGSDRSEVFRKFQHYGEFYNRYFSGISLFDNDNYFWTRHINVDQRKIAILGLNSAWMCSFNKDDGDIYRDDGILLVGERQINSARDRVGEENDLIISLLHHPYSSLNQEFEAHRTTSLLRRHSDFVLRGHVHRSDFVHEMALAGETIVIPAGAAYDRRDRPTSGYNIVRLNLATGKGELFLRRYEDDPNEWMPDLANAGKNSNGIQTFNLPKRLLPSQSRKVVI